MVGSVITPILEVREVTQLLVAELRLKPGLPPPEPSQQQLDGAEAGRYWGTTPMCPLAVAAERNEHVMRDQ